MAKLRAAQSRQRIPHWLQGSLTIEALTAINNLERRAVPPGAISANALTDSINHERMPVLLSEETDFETWLSGSPAEAFALARSYDPCSDADRAVRI